MAGVERGETKRVKVLMLLGGESTKTQGVVESLRARNDEVVDLWIAPSGREENTQNRLQSWLQERFPSSVPLASGSPDGFLSFQVGESVGSKSNVHIAGGETLLASVQRCFVAAPGQFIQIVDVLAVGQELGADCKSLLGTLKEYLSENKECELVSETLVFPASSVIPQPSVEDFFPSPDYKVSKVGDEGLFGVPFELGMKNYNLDFRRRVVIDTNARDWVPSPAAGVWRKPLSRADAERGHATSIVKYEPGSSFKEHGHPQGEEILVLDGTFSDQTGDFNRGMYFRNPEGFRHAPFSKEGTVILVELHQFQPDDEDRVAIDTLKSDRWEVWGDGIDVLLLHRWHNELVRLERWGKNSRASINLAECGGEELYVMSGSVADEAGRYPAGTFVRNPNTDARHLRVSEEGALVWRKTGVLPHFKPEELQNLQSFGSMTFSIRATGSSASIGNGQP